LELPDGGYDMGLIRFIQKHNENATRKRQLKVEKRQLKTEKRQAEAQERLAKAAERRR
jgi:hypothetical protein